ncbi:MAG: hypothetical protein D6705_04735 [Deltaproteobacteria bacterium]|nr:MAG: hypothetical protein D6705_04735 [Deltaproteobacteria bacterium]
MRRRLTFEAALRDLTAQRDEARALALRCLPSALLERHGLEPPAAHAATLGPDGARAVEAVLERLEREPLAELRGIALWALAMLGDGSIVGAARRALANETAPYVHESAVQAMGIVGAVVPREDPVLQEVSAFVADALRDERPWVRAQAAQAAVTAKLPGAESMLVGHLGAERDDDVRDACVCALAELDPPGAEACDRLVEALDDEALPHGTRLAAARGLAAARRTEGARLLAAALRRPFERDDALEALAVVAPRLPAETRDAVVTRARRIAAGFLTPVTTRVRAAYLLARIAPEEGERLLARFERRGGRVAREAVADARAALARLAREEA